MPSSVLYPLCSWRDLAMCCAAFRSLRLRCPCGLTVIVIVLLTRFCTCNAMGPLCHQYFATEDGSYCGVMRDKGLEKSAVRCKDNQVCCKYLSVKSRTHSEYTQSRCRDATDCEDFPGPTYCKETNGPNHCQRGCQDDKCGMSYQFPGRNKLQFFIWRFESAASLGPLIEQQDPNEVPLSSYVRSVFMAAIRKSPEQFGCVISVEFEPGDDKRMWINLQFVVYENKKTSKFLNDLKSEHGMWRMLDLENWKNFTTTISSHGGLFQPYDFTLPCPAHEDECRGIHTKWPYILSVGQFVSVLCSQEGGFNPQKFAERRCEKGGKWKSINFRRCDPPKDELSSTQVNKLPEDGDADEARTEGPPNGSVGSQTEQAYSRESAGFGLLPMLLIGVGVCLTIVAIVVGLAYWKLKGSSSSENVAVENQQPPEQQEDGEDIESQDDGGTGSEAGTEYFDPSP